MHITLENKVVVVTGSSSGIGAELVNAFAMNGANVVVHYNTKENEAKRIYESVSKYGTDCLLIKANLTDEAQVKYLYNEVLAHYGKVDILINNAGMCKDSLCTMMSSNTWHQVIETNLSSVFYCCKHFSKNMISRKSGKIINIASYKGIVGCKGQVNYSASKAGIVGLTKTVARELASFNISANVLCPGFIVTPLNSGNTEKLKKASEQSLLSITDNMKTLVHTILFMASDLFQGVTGQVIHIDSRVV